MNNEKIVLDCLKGGSPCDKCPYQNYEIKCHHILDIVHAIRNPFWYVVHKTD